MAQRLDCSISCDSLVGSCNTFEYNHLQVPTADIVVSFFKKLGAPLSVLKLIN